MTLRQTGRRDLIAALNKGKVDLADEAMRAHVRHGTDQVVRGVGTALGDPAIRAEMTLRPTGRRDLIAALNKGKVDLADEAMRAHVRHGTDQVVRS